MRSYTSNEEILCGFHTLFEEELPGETFAWILQAPWQELGTTRDDFQKWQAVREGRTRQLEEQEQAKRHQFQDMLPLPRRVAPRLSEDLASVIVRTAQVMGYPQPGRILRPQRAEHTIAAGELALLPRL